MRRLKNQALLYSFSLKHDQTNFGFFFCDMFEAYRNYSISFLPLALLIFFQRLKEFHA